MALQTLPVVKAQMLIRKPIEEVFEAFVDPAVTTKFWFTKSSGRLEPGKVVRWEWEMYGVWADIQVRAVEPNRRILIEWDEPPMPVEWLFFPHTGNTTLVRITTSGFSGENDDEVVDKAIDSMGGFTIVLAGLKAYLEYGIELNMVADAKPEGFAE